MFNWWKKKRKEKTKDEGFYYTRVKDFTLECNQCGEQESMVSSKPFPHKPFCPMLKCKV